MALSTECSAGEVLASPFQASPLQHHWFHSLAYTWCTPSKLSTHHWVGPRKSVSNRAPHFLMPALVDACASLCYFAASQLRRNIDRTFCIFSHSTLSESKNYRDHMGLKKRLKRNDEISFTLKLNATNSDGNLCEVPADDRSGIRRPSLVCAIGKGGGRNRFLIRLK